MPVHEVHVAWARTADFSSQDWSELDDHLDALEHERAQRFHFEADRHAYVLAHALLRALVAGAAHQAAASVRLLHDARGRPVVDGEPRWNISNARTRKAVACAVTLAAPVGIDVEAIDPRADAELLTPYIAGDPAPDSREFFERWALLEAFWKAWGTGLSQDNPRIVVAPTDAGHFRICAPGGGSDCVGTGWILDASEDCATALVLRGPLDEPLQLHQIRCTSAGDINQLSNAIQFG